jgi:hypothetical protein
MAQLEKTLAPPTSDRADEKIVPDASAADVILTAEDRTPPAEGAPASAPEAPILTGETPPAGEEVDAAKRENKQGA